MFKTVNHYETTDYSVLKLFPFNREIKRSHVKTLVENMRVYGFSSVIQVVKTNVINGIVNYYIADGQHRVEAAKQLGLAVKFNVIEFDNKLDIVDYVAKLNSSSQKFSASNYLNTWSKVEVSEYVKIESVVKETGFQITPVLEAYLFSSNQTDYRNGKMKFPNEVESDKIIKQMIETNQFLPTKAFCRRSLVRVMCNKKYDHKKMITAIKNYKKLVGNFSENELEYRKELEKLMNNY
jgi:hypothetical protein